MMRRLEQEFGYYEKLTARLHPIVVRIVDSGPPSEARTDMLRLVVEAYSHHVSFRDTLDRLRAMLRDRLNTRYARLLGIDPPCIG